MGVINTKVYLPNEGKATVEDIASDLFTNDTGVPYTDLLAVGANPSATIFRDGTIIGSTDNGLYRRGKDFAYCYNLSISAPNSNSPIGNIYQSNADTTWTFPLVFSEVPIFTASSKNSNGVWSSTPIGSGISSTVFRAMSGTSIGTAIPMMLTAKGKI